MFRLIDLIITQDSSSRRLTVLPTKTSLAPWEWQKKSIFDRTDCLRFIWKITIASRDKADLFIFMSRFKDV